MFARANDTMCYEPEDYQPELRAGGNSLVRCLHRILSFKNVTRISENVVRRFVIPAPYELPMS